MMCDNTINTDCYNNLLMLTKRDTHFDNHNFTLHG